MSPKLPVCTAQEVLKVLQKAGWTLHRQKGSHVILKRASGGRVIVPMHPGDVPSGTLRSIIRDAGMTVEAFTENL